MVEQLRLTEARRRQVMAELDLAATGLRAAAVRHAEMIGSERAYDVAWLLWSRGQPIPERLRAMI
jgi:hypothetical protein